MTARQLRPFELRMAAPRGYCAGVVRAINIVERALEIHGRPVYVRRAIIHNEIAVADLAARGAVFVENVDDAPEGSVMILSAHGVSPEIAEEAATHCRVVIDATCPLVTKVHHEVRRFAAGGRRVVLIGDESHDEVQGTRAEAFESIVVLAPHSDPAEAGIAATEPIAWVSQTTLATDDVESTVRRLHEHFDDVVGPRSSDICYATQNRQDAVRAVSQGADLVIIVGSPTSANTARLVEVAERAGATRAVRIASACEMRGDVLGEAAIVGLSAGASTPERVVDGVVEWLIARGGVPQQVSTAVETVTFKLPEEIQ